MSASVATKPRKRRKLFGSEVPRLFTPPLRELTPETSLGFNVIEFAGEVLKIQLLPWQRWLLIHALEIDDGRLRFRNVLVLVARQNGKSTISIVLALWWLFICGVGRVVGTAQDLAVAESIWDDAWSLVEATPELLADAAPPVRRNGARAMLTKSGGRYVVKSANRSAARGLSGDRIILDELREHQSWEAWAAISKTTMARRNAQVWGFSNAGDATSVVLAYLRQVAHEALGDPDGIVAKSKVGAPTRAEVESLTADGEFDELADMLAMESTTGRDDDPEEDSLDVDSEDLFIAEWSAPPGCSIWDESGWVWANPSLGWIIDRSAIRSAARLDPEWVFRTEVLCQWPEGGLAGPFKSGSWDSTLNPTVETMFGPELARENWIVGPVVACVAVASDRSRAHIAIAGRRDDGMPQVEIHASRTGTDWIKPWLMARRDRITAVTAQARGALAAPVLADLAADVEFTIPTVPLEGTNLIAAFGDAYDRLKSGRVRHNPQIALDLAAAAATTKNLAGGKVIDLLSSPVDAAPLEAWIGALWLLNRPVRTPRPPTAAVAMPGTPAARTRTTGAVGVNLNVEF